MKETARHTPKFIWIAAVVVLSVLLLILLIKVLALLKVFHV